MDAFDEDVLTEPSAAPHLTGLYAQVAQTPGDLTLCGAIADALEELGYGRLPYAFRYMMHRKIWPHRRLLYGDGRKVPARHRWAWYREYNGAGARAMPASDWNDHRLDPFLMGEPFKTFPDHSRAVYYLADALQKLHDVYALQPKPRGS